jgi:hypothetical protein
MAAIQTQVRTSVLPSGNWGNRVQLRHPGKILVALIKLMLIALLLLGVRPARRADTAEVAAAPRPCWLRQ